MSAALGNEFGLSQSATSHALDRLRKLLGDELLVRTASGMEPTPRALSLAGPLRLALQDIQTALAPDRFEPAEAEIGLTIAVETHETIVVLPLLVEEVRREAPGIVLTVRSGSLEDILNGVDQGRADIAIGVFKGIPDRFMTCRLLSDDHACVMRADHPLGRSPLTLKRYLDAPHLLISMSGGTTNAVDDALAEQGLRRRIVMQMPHSLAAVIALTLLGYDHISDAWRSAGLRRDCSGDHDGPSLPGSGVYFPPGVELTFPSRSCSHLAAPKARCNRGRR